MDIINSEKRKCSSRNDPFLFFFIQCMHCSFRHSLKSWNQWC